MQSFLISLYIQSNSEVPPEFPNLAAQKIDAAERSISIGRESLQVYLDNRHHGIIAGFTARGQS
jgi:hypothetical protein